MTRVKYFGILVLVLALFAFFAPVVPFNTSIMNATDLRDECGGGGSSIFPPVTIYVSITYRAFDNYGTVFLPKGVPGTSDGNALHFEPYGPNHPLECG